MSGPVMVNGVVFTPRQIQFLTSLSATAWRSPKRTFKKRTIQSLEARGFLQMALPNERWAITFGYDHYPRMLTEKGVHVVKIIRQRRRSRRRRK